MDLFLNGIQDNSELCLRLNIMSYVSVHGSSEICSGNLVDGILTTVQKFEGQDLRIR